MATCQTCFPFERRQTLHLKKYSSSEERQSVLRVVSYNVLADCYSSTSYTIETVFPYCPAQFLSHSYRKVLLAKELPGYDGDIMCLQEVDEHAFLNDYQPLLNTFGYDGVLALKTQAKKEGVAVFYRRNRFELVENSSYLIGSCLDQDPEFFSPLKERISQAPSIRDMFVTRSSVLQLVHLVEKSSGQRLLIANTHLYFNWTANNIRLLQAFVCSRIISRTKSTIQAATGQSPKVIFCGDFNSDYRRGVYRMLTTGSVPANFNEFYFGGLQASYIPDLGSVLQSNLRFFSAAGKPEYTTFIAGYAAAIDYIYAEQDQFEVVASLPMYDESEFIAHTALPNELFPSDHMAVVVDLKYKA